MHWADVVAEKLMQRGDEHVLATAITPSGPIHVGNLREVMTTEAIYRALKDRGAKAKLIFIADTFDPLRKVYPFLDKSYEKYVGMPLSSIPCPCDEHENYAEHFLQPFIEAMDELGIKPEIYKDHELYAQGFYKNAIKTALDNADKIGDILNEISGRNLPEGWMPFNVLCENCSRLTGEIKEYEYPSIKYECKCGWKNSVNINECMGKMPWRVEWPARWSLFGVTFEAFGKDHASPGGSWDTGKVIAKEVFNYEPPMPFVYEFIHLKGRGAMHGSTGLAIAASEVVKMVPAEVLRFLFMKYEPSRHIEFDASFGLLDLVDEYDEYERVYFGMQEARAGMKDVRRVYELSQPYGTKAKMPLQIPYRHLAVVAQIAKNFDEVIEIIQRRTELQKFDEERLRERYEKIKYWLKNYAPDAIKFEVLEKFEGEMDKRSIEFLERLKNKLETIEWDAEKIHSAIHETIKEYGISAKEGFEAIYKIIIGKKRGPRAGYFLQSLGKEFVLSRIHEVIQK